MFWNQLIWILEGITFILDIALQRSEKQSHCGPTVHVREFNCSPPRHHKLSSHCLGLAPEAGLIAAVWHCGECILTSTRKFFLLSLRHTKICHRKKHVSNSDVSTVVLSNACLFHKVSSNKNEFHSTVWWMVDLMCVCLWVAKVVVGLSAITSLTEKL